MLHQVPQDAQDYKTELKRIQDYVVDLHKRVMATCDSFSEDVKFWAEYKTGIRVFKPWLAGAEKTSGEGLSKPKTLDEANAMFAVIKAFEAGCLKHLKVNISIETNTIVSFYILPECCTGLYSPDLSKCYFLQIHTKICSKVPIFYFNRPKHPPL